MREALPMLQIPSSQSFDPPRSGSLLRKRRKPQVSKSFSPSVEAVGKSPRAFTFSPSTKSPSKSKHSGPASSPRKSFKFSKPFLHRRAKSLSLAEECDPCSSTNGKQKNKKKKAHSLSPKKRIKFFRRIKNPHSFVRNSSEESKSSMGTLTESDESIAKPMIDQVVVSPSSAKIKEANVIAKQDRNSFDFNCATAILGQSYLELCGGSYNHIFSDYPSLPEDPTVQESVECVFEYQLQNGLEPWDDNEEFVQQNSRSLELQSPALLQQSRLNRSTRGRSLMSQQSQQSIKRYQQVSLRYLGSYDPALSPVSTGGVETDQCESSSICQCAKSDLPALNPKDWPQAPLLLRPTPGSGTRIKGIRFTKETEHLWTPESNTEWPDMLAKKWGKESHACSYGCCERCAILPINNGNESSGDSLIIDFETDEFEGSFLLRLRFTEGTTPEPYDDSKGYFEGMNRRYQAVVRGRFKKSIPFTELATGFQYKRPCGKLPPKWILRGGIKVISFFAPQLDAKFEGDRPHTLSPLGSTPQSIAVEDEASNLLDGLREEPKDASRTLLAESSLAESSLQRGKFRKRNFDKLFVQESLEPKTDPSKTYTFEFLQHLFNFQNFSIELGSMLGSVQLEEILDGQPLQVMATHGDKPLWSFDIWHECLWERARIKGEAPQ